MVVDFDCDPHENVKTSTASQRHKHSARISLPWGRILKSSLKHIGSGKQSQKVNSKDKSDPEQSSKSS
jgi:hypothetical protein